MAAMGREMHAACMLLAWLENTQEFAWRGAFTWRYHAMLQHKSERV